MRESYSMNSMFPSSHTCHPSKSNSLTKSFVIKSNSFRPLPTSQYSYRSIQLLSYLFFTLFICTPNYLFASPVERLRHEVRSSSPATSSSFRSHAAAASSSSSARTLLQADAQSLKEFSGGSTQNQKVSTNRQSYVEDDQDASVDEPATYIPSVEDLAKAKLHLNSTSQKNDAYKLIGADLPCGSHCSFSFPRPAVKSGSRSFYITASPNHGAGLGHQFGEWLMGPWLAVQLGLTYVYTGFLINSARWSTFLGFGEGEETAEDLVATYGDVKLIVRDFNQEKSLAGMQYIPQEMFRIRGEIQQQLLAANVSLDPDVSNSKTEVIPLNLAQASLTPGVPFPVLFHYRVVHVPSQNYACEPTLQRVLRQKYCAARIKKPLPVDLYEDDRKRNRIVVALHLRCGDSCYNTYRATPFPSVIRTVALMSGLLKQADPEREASFHIFSQGPRNDTAENHFKPLLDGVAGMRVTTHFTTSSTTTLHHLVKSDVLLGSQSSFSWLATLLKHSISMGPMKSCLYDVPYERSTGEFDASTFLKHYAASKHLTPKFDSWQDCLNIE